MKNLLLCEAGKYAEQNSRRRIWRKFVRMMACIVVFCTTYVLILPAITMERPTACGLEEHSHTEKCYQQIKSVQNKTLSCTYESLDVHVHSVDCYDEEESVICGQADYVVHEHTPACQDENAMLLCHLPKVQAHTHTQEECFKTVETGHRHSDSCYTQEQGELTCEITESAGHSHTDECWLKGNLLCTTPESTGHTHGPDCWKLVLKCLEEHEHADSCFESQLFCTLEESEGHSHGLSCYEKTLNCGQEESAGHSHGDSCYAQKKVLTCTLEEDAETETILICEKEELIIHSHEDDCYIVYADESGEEQKSLSCEETVVLEHIHDESCYTVTETPVDTESLTCTEPENHTHSEDCYDAEENLTCTVAENHIHGKLCYGTWELICEEEEHAHEESCYVQLSEEQQVLVDAVIAAIEEMPSADEIDAKIAEFAEQGDENGEITYLQVVYAQVQQVYRQYMALDQELQPYVTNAEKLMELEYIWSQITLNQTYNYSDLPHAAENTRIYLFDYGHMINEKIEEQGIGLLPFYRIFPEYGYTVDGEAAWDHDTVGGPRYGQLDTKAPVINNTLVDGYPYIASGNQAANGSWLTQWGSLQYLFDPDYVAGNYWDKSYWATEIRKNTTFTNPYTADAVNPSGLAAHFRRAYLPVKNDGTGTGLFQRDEEGYWYYDSGKNAAWYNPQTEQFELYNYTVIPGHEAFDNYGGTTNGNFLPFNKGHVEGLTDYQTSEKKVHDSGGDLNLNSGEVRWDNRVTANIGDVVDGYPLLRENFRLITSDRTNSVNLNFGMVVEFDFYMPKDGMINGKPMEFIFKGDDDVWVFIDDVLVLDIGGCHGAESASINFATGVLSQPSGAGYHKPTTLKNAFANAGIADGFNGDTFANFTAHTLKFFYMERGGNISFCRLKFNMPQLPKNAISVKKELSSDVKTLGNPDYTFALMAQESDGKTRRLFVGNANAPNYSVFAKTKYRIVNADGTYLTNPNPVADDPQLFATDEYGIFKIKAGQTAVFEEIPATDAADFYVQELIKEADYKQYMNDAADNKCTSDIQVNGKTPIWQGKINWAGRTYFADKFNKNEPYLGPYGIVWYGASGPITDASAGASSGFYFNQQNGVYEDRLAKLSITKNVSAAAGAPALTYKINVELDGKPLPAGTTYKVGDETRTVGFDADGNSYVELANGGTAVISNILSGTKFRVWESEESAEGHNVEYSVTAQGSEQDAAVTDSGVTGTLRVNDHVKLTATNTRIPQEISISVVKQLTSTTGVGMVGDPEFSFQIMKGDAAGNRTDTALYGEGVSYNVYDATTGALLRENEETEQYGIFKIKAGERAQFTGIREEEVGNYYIREVLEKTFISQYDNYYVDGAEATVVDIPGFSTHKGVVSAVKNSYSGNTVFTFNNQVKTEKLSYLTITKMVEGVSSDVEKTLEFDMMVELNGVLNSTDGWTPIPVGTPYTLYDTNAFVASNGKNKVKIADRPDRVVTTEGIVTVPGGATAEIDYMIPGTTFRVYETTDSAEGYTVSYGEFWGGQWITAYSDRVEGTIPVYTESNLNEAHVCMTVTNTLPATKVEFSVYKQMVNGNLDANAHTVNFTANCIEAKAKNGSSVDALLGTGAQTGVTIGDDQWKEAKFLIGYDYYKQFDGHVATNNWPVRLIYEITEVPSEDLEYTHDATKYYVAVDVNLTKVWGSWNFTATLITPVPVYENNTVPESDYATFTNQLLGDLTLEKQVDGGQVSQKNGSFNFSVQIGTNGTTALQNWDVQIIKNGESVGTENTGTNGVVNLTGIKHGDKVQLKGIPLGCVWRITETNADGYIVSWKANETSDNSNVATGNIPAGGMEVVFTNRFAYELPQTGSRGTTVYALAGMMLILFSTAYLMYTVEKRRREGS